MSVSEALQRLSGDARDATEEAGVPDWTSPMLATLTDDYFSDPDWVFERKLDGVRLLAFRDEADVRLLTRNREERGSTYPEVAEALEEEGGDRFVADGEVVAFEGDVTSFELLQDRMRIDDPEEARESDVSVSYYLFDLLHLGGRDLTDVPLRDRKRVLKAAFAFGDPIRFLPHRNEDGKAYLEEACSDGREGVIAKRASSGYVHDRSEDWLKFKCVNRQEFVVGGWTDPEGERIGLGALLLGYHEDGALSYAGKVGTGFDDERLRELSDALGNRERETSPFVDDAGPSGSDVHWATPELVAEVAFTEWTDDGKLRHPRFEGLRRDKDAEDVVRERPEESPA